VFCGVLRCFVCVFLAFFTKQTKTDQKIYKTHKTNKIRFRFVQNSAKRCGASFSHSENVYKKHSQNTSKTLQNIRKTPQNTAKHCFATNTRKTPQNTRKTPAKHPQNTAKHHKTDLLTKQTKLANKPLRSRQEACAVCQGASDAPTGKVRRLTWVQMGPTWNFKSFLR